MKIGLVDLDTSHPLKWVPLEREMGHQVVGVWDGGAVHPASYVEQFAHDHQIDRVYPTLEQMVPDVDCAIIHACDWDTHLDKARPFIDAGKAVLIDKPLVGNPSDLAQLQRWADDGARITGGSSLRFCDEAQAFLATDPQERGTPHTALVGCGVDPFNYGIHAYALLAALLGPDAVAVRHLAETPQRRVEITWADGRVGLVVVGAGAKWLPFHASVATEQGVHQFVVDNGGIYAALLRATLPYLAGEQAAPPLSMRDLLAPERWALAAEQSYRQGSAEVRLDALDPALACYDGGVFAEGYRRARYPGAG